jgi:16S rRNA processing protein RimM
VEKHPSEKHRPPLDADDAIIVGRIVGHWGLRGDLRVEPLTDLLQRFAPGSVLYLNGRAARVVRADEHKGHLLVKLDLANNRAQAQALRGTELTVPREEAKPLPEGSYYYFQIIDIAVWAEDGEYLGEVKEVLSTTGRNDVYVVRDEEKKEVLVPALKGVILEVDLEGNRMVVRLPDGLR